MRDVLAGQRRPATVETGVAEGEEIAEAKGSDAGDQKVVPAQNEGFLAPRPGARTGLCRGFSSVGRSGLLACHRSVSSPGPDPIGM